VVVVFENILEGDIHGIKTIRVDNNSAVVGVQNYNFIAAR
jgi:hypothetical protein